MTSVVAPPSRGRGLKYRKTLTAYDSESVAPLAGAWIEIFLRYADLSERRVAPLAGGVD